MTTLLTTRHSAAMRTLARDVQAKAYLLHYFQLRPMARESLASALERRGLGQADVVLALLRARLVPGARAHVEALIGHGIQVGPPCLLYYRTNGPPRVKRVVVRVTAVVPENPRTEPLARRRFEEFRVGRTEEQLMARGITRRELTWVRKQGWVSMQEFHA